MCRVVRWGSIPTGSSAKRVGSVSVNHFGCNLFSSGRLIARVEHGEKGTNPRFIVINLKGDPQMLYKQVYCARCETCN
jgi:hypothetical protein